MRTTLRIRAAGRGRQNLPGPRVSPWQTSALGFVVVAVLDVVVGVALWRVLRPASARFLLPLRFGELVLMVWLLWRSRAGR
jgi:hypothetical protein